MWVGPLGSRRGVIWYSLVTGALSLRCRNFNPSFFQLTLGRNNEPLGQNGVGGYSYMIKEVSSSSSASVMAPDGASVSSFLPFNSKQLLPKG